MPNHPPMSLTQPFLGWNNQARPMDIPATPEALFEALAEPSLRQLFPRFDTLKPRNQKLVRLLHTELTKGELCDSTFMEFIGFILVLWRSFNNAALETRQTLIDTEDEIDTDWVESAIHLARVEQYLTHMLVALENLPGFSTEDSNHAKSQYQLLGPGD